MLIIAHALFLVITSSLLLCHSLTLPLKTSFLKVPVYSRQLPIHLDSPTRSEPSHRPNDATARDRDHTDARKQPTVANCRNKRLCYNGTHARKNVTDTVVERHAGGRVARHEFRQHGGDHAKDEHTANAKEKVGHELESEVSRILIGDDARGPGESFQ